MQFKHKIMVLAVLPLIAVTIAMGWMMNIQAERLVKVQAGIIKERILASHQEELRSHMSIAVSSISHLYNSNRNDMETQNQVKTILRNIRYGRDGYFWIYDFKGNCLMHPYHPENVGTNRLNAPDRLLDGRLKYPTMVEVARQGGGFLEYNWEKPSQKNKPKSIQKLVYYFPLHRWGWIIGTGVYHDDLEKETNRMRNEVTANIHSTLQGLALIAIVSAIIVFSGGIVLTINERQLANGKLKELAQRLVMTQEEERARVSRELHDGISNSLVSTQYQFELVGYQLKENLNDAQLTLRKGLKSLNDTITEVRHLSHVLRPIILDNDLPGALQQLVNEFSERTGIRMTMRADISLEIVPETATVTLFRIAQEALTNIERHAYAQSVSICLEQISNEIRLSIVDDGCGFDVQAVRRSSRKGIGLCNMRERLAHHGGDLMLSSVLGRTELLAIMPLAKR